MKTKKIAEKNLKALKNEYADFKTKLNYNSPIELLNAIILSAQCTDNQVNKVTSKLFLKYKTIKDYACADLKEFEQDIKSTGFYKNKAKNIIKTANILIEKYNSIIPDNMLDLVSLSGVGRKTANLVLSHLYNKNEGIAVDTHVMRLSMRLGLTESKNPDKIEKDLMCIFDKKDWGIINSVLISHGRAICKARKPLCNECVIRKACECIL